MDRATPRAAPAFAGGAGGLGAAGNGAVTGGAGCGATPMADGDGIGLTGTA